MISQMDHNVGRLLDTLKACGLDKNTIVIFTSDNGTTHDAGGVDHRFFNSVADLKGLKGQLYEGGIRVPGIIRWPGKIAPGKTIAQPAFHADVMPTLCALTGGGCRFPAGNGPLPCPSGQKNPPCMTGNPWFGQEEATAAR